MALHSLVISEMNCHRCGEPGCFEIEVFVGPINVNMYRVGDSFEWEPRRAVQNGGRPPSGDLDAQGYTVCPACERDFFVTVAIRGDIVTSATPDPTKEPYIRG